MQVRVLFFGVLKDLASRSTEVLELPEGAVAADVLKHYERSVGKGILSSVAISVNQEYSAPEVPLHTGDEIALLPPVSGGTSRARIVREGIDAAAITDEIKRGEDGACVVFEGVVRNHSRGRRTLFLEYEAYEEMAVKEVESIIAQALRQVQMPGAPTIHRFVRPHDGEAKVALVWRSPVRGADCA